MIYKHDPKRGVWKHISDEHPVLKTGNVLRVAGLLESRLLRIFGIASQIALCNNAADFVTDFDAEISVEPTSFSLKWWTRVPF